MLLRFGVSNHLSICESQELSFSVSSLKDRDEGLIDCAATPSGSVLPAIVLYGANASGKSNIVSAIETMRGMVLGSQTLWDPDGGVPRHPFQLDAASLQAPSQFDIDFTIRGVRFHYGFEASDSAFVSEWLYDYPKAHRRTLFEREGNKFHFGRGLKGRNKAIAGLTRSNSLYLSAAAQNDHEQLSSIFSYFRSIRTSHEIAVTGALVSRRLAEEEPANRVIEFLKNIGTGVIDYRRKEPELPKLVQFVPQDFVAELRKRMDLPERVSNVETRQINIELGHRSRDGKPVYFDLDRESAGTRRLLVTLGFAFRALDEGTALVIDELDASLHTHASEAVLKLFCSPETNAKGAQLVATTHDTNLMASALLRRDQLWFSEKDADGATQLYPLSDIRTRKGDNIEKGYLQGRYGAVPFNCPTSSLGTRQ